MYLTEITAEQVSAPSYEPHCQVRVRWAYGYQTPDVIEFWWQAGSNANWELILPHISVDENNPVHEAEITIPSGVPGIIRACPRMTDDSGNLEYSQPDDSGEELIWN